MKRPDAERALRRQAAMHQLKHMENLERILAGLLATAAHGKRCHCAAAKALRDLAAELDAAEPR